jgi:hypothetical protein
MSEEDKIYEYLVANSKIKRTPKAIMTEEEFKTKYKYRSWEWPKIGDKVKFKTFLGMFYPYFTNVIQFAKDNLKVGEIYTVRNCEVYSSWCAVWLDEIEGDHFFHLSMFEWPIKEGNNE